MVQLLCCDLKVTHIARQRIFPAATETEVDVTHELVLPKCGVVSSEDTQAVDGLLQLILLFFVEPAVY